MLGGRATTGDGNGAPLEDARHLAQRYDRTRQEAEAQVSSCLFTSFTPHCWCIQEG
jgi:hypothetical protein